MNRILSLMKFDLTNALRDSMVIYILVAPLVLAGGLRLFLPSFEASTVTFAVEIPAEQVNAGELFADRLEEYGRVERYRSAAAVRERVAATDSVGGFVMSEPAGEGWTIVLEGNEGPASVGLMQAVLRAATAPSSGAEYTIVRTGNRSPITEYVSVGLVMFATLIGGLAVSFSMIDEKEQRVTSAFAVTPLGGVEYFAARGILAALVGIVVATAGHLLLVGASVPFAGFALALVGSAPLPLVVALLIGGIAKNQIQAVAALKVVILVYLTLPFASIAVPARLHWLFYALPNYWMFRSFQSIYVGAASSGDLPQTAVLTLVTGSVVLILLGVGVGSKLKPRRG